MKIAVIDDEKMFRDMLQVLCCNFCSQKKMPLSFSEFENADTFLSSFTLCKYDLVFIDVFMPGTNGVTCARRIRELDNSLGIIFLTSSQNHMPDAFSCHAFDYIVKPFHKERIQKALNEFLAQSSTYEPYIEITCDRKTVPVKLCSILSVVTDCHYLILALDDDRQLRTRMTLSSFIGLTNNDSRFLSINKGILVQLDAIHHFDATTCHLTNGTIFPVRVRDRAQIEETFQRYHFLQQKN